MPKIQEKRITSTETTQEMAPSILISASVVSNGDITMERTSVPKFSIGLLQHFLPLFVIFYLRVRGLTFLARKK